WRLSGISWNCTAEPCSPRATASGAARDSRSRFLAYRLHRPAERPVKNTTFERKARKAREESCEAPFAVFAGFAFPGSFTPSDACALLRRERGQRSSVLRC